MIILLDHWHGFCVINKAKNLLAAYCNGKRRRGDLGKKLTIVIKRM